MADVIALIDDLFFLAKVHETAKHTGVTLETAATGEQVFVRESGGPLLGSEWTVEIWV